MALVREMRIGGPNGAIVRIFDDDYANIDAAEMEARRAHVGETVRQILKEQIERGITSGVRKLDVPPKDVLYDRLET